MDRKQLMDAMMTTFFSDMRRRCFNVASNSHVVESVSHFVRFHAYCFTFLHHSLFAGTAHQIPQNVTFRCIFIRHGASGGRTVTVSVNVFTSDATPMIQALSTGLFCFPSILINKATLT
jgi:hypothetical protein